MAKKPRRRKQHRAKYYRQAIPAAATLDEVLDLVEDAAKQPRSVLSDTEYTEIFWLGQKARDKFKEERK